MSDRIVTMVRADLSFDQPWAVSGVTDALLDQPALHDPRAATRAAYLPTTSLMGSLKRLPEWAPLLGGQPGAYGGKTGVVHYEPSAAWALGAVLSPGADLVRIAATSIDRDRRAAEEGALRESEHVEAGGFAMLHLQVEGRLQEQQMAALAAWQPWVGRGRTQGYGRTSVAQVSFLELDLDQEADLTWWLDERAAWFDGHPPSGSMATRVHLRPGQSHAECTVSWTFRTTDPLAPGGEALPGQAVSPGASDLTPAIRTEPPGASNHRPARRDPQGKVLVPGSTWKGVLRHRATFILTALGASDDLVRVCIDALFGSAANSDGTMGGRGLLRFVDSTVCGSGEQERKRRTHVAIDRITGGAAEKLLFSVDSAGPNSTLDLVVHSAQPLGQQTKLLFNWIVKDIHDGLVGVGGMTSRGYGSLELDASPTSPLSPIDVSALVAELGLEAPTTSGAGS